MRRTRLEGLALQNVVRLFENYLAQLSLAVLLLLVDAIVGRFVEVPLGFLAFWLVYVPVCPALYLLDSFLHFGLDGPVGF